MCRGEIARLKRNHVDLKAAPFLQFWTIRLWSKIFWSSAAATCGNRRDPQLQPTAPITARTRFGTLKSVGFHRLHVSARNGQRLVLRWVWAVSSQWKAGRTIRDVKVCARRFQTERDPESGNASWDS
jgi:hypothetical protein